MGSDLSSGILFSVDCLSDFCSGLVDVLGTAIAVEISLLPAAAGEDFWGLIEDFRSLCTAALESFSSSPTVGSKSSAPAKAGFERTGEFTAATSDVASTLGEVGTTAAAAGLGFADGAAASTLVSFSSLTSSRSGRRFSNGDRGFFGVD